MTNHVQLHPWLKRATTKHHGPIEEEKSVECGQAPAVKMLQVLQAKIVWLNLQATKPYFQVCGGCR